MKCSSGDMMMKINKIDNETNKKYLEENCGTNILPLSLLENMTLIGSTPLEVLLYYKKEWSFEEVKESFLKAANHFNLFSSRLIMIDHDKFALQYCTDGVEFHLLPPIDDTFDNINIEDIKKKIVKVKTLPGEPLLSLTVIPLKNGKLGGVSCSHPVGDGFSLILFLHLWGCIIEGKDLPQPSTQRLFKGNPVSSDKIDKAFTPPLSELSDEIQNRYKLSNVKTYKKREYFSDEFLNEMKNKAKSENEKYEISDNQIMNSFLLKKYHNYILPKTDKIRLRHPINLRDIHPDIDPMYIGNAFFFSWTEFTKDEIDKMSIYEIAKRLKESIKKGRDKDFIQEISYVSKYGIEFKPEMLKYYNATDTDTDILSTNLSHMNDLGTLGIGPDKGSFLYVNLPIQNSFIMLKEKSGEVFAQITSRHELI
jgi:hypothetical protein